MQYTHKDIIERCKEGNRQAQFELYRLYSKAMYNTCVRMLKSTEDAEDVLQDSFVDVFTKLDSFKYESSIGAWIKRVVINNCINFLRKRKIAFSEVEEERLMAAGTNYFTEETEYPAAIDNLSVIRIKKGLSLLPDGYRVVFSLFLLDGYDHKEIAEILGISESTSKTQYHRAKKKLREILHNMEHANS